MANTCLAPVHIGSSTHQHIRIGRHLSVLQIGIQPAHRAAERLPQRREALAAPGRIISGSRPLRIHHRNGLEHAGREALDDGLDGRLEAGLVELRGQRHLLGLRPSLSVM